MTLDLSVGAFIPSLPTLIPITCLDNLSSSDRKHIMSTTDQKSESYGRIALMSNSGCCCVLEEKCDAHAAATPSDTAIDYTTNLNKTTKGGA